MWFILLLALSKSCNRIDNPFYNLTTANSSKQLTLDDPTSVPIDVCVASNHGGIHSTKFVCADSGNSVVHKYYRGSSKCDEKESVSVDTVPVTSAYYDCSSSVPCPYVLINVSADPITRRCSGDRVLFAETAFVINQCTNAYNYSNNEYDNQYRQVICTEDGVMLKNYVYSPDCDKYPTANYSLATGCRQMDNDTQAYIQIEGACPTGDHGDGIKIDGLLIINLAVFISLFLIIVGIIACCCLRRRRQSTQTVMLIND